MLMRAHQVGARHERRDRNDQQGHGVSKQDRVEGELRNGGGLCDCSRHGGLHGQRREAETMAGYAAKTEIGWGHQIRSYVLQPYQMVKDLRTGVVSTAPSDVLDGDLDPFMAAALSQRVSGETVEVEDVD